MNQTVPSTKPSRLDLVKQGKVQALPFQGEQRNVAIERLIENPQNERKTYRNMDGLIATVKAAGIIEPLIVEPADDDKFLIIVGHRRYRAAQALGLTKAPVIIGDPQANTIRRRKSIISNVQREDVGPIEMAEGLQALLDEDPEITTQRELAAAIGKTETWVSGVLRILKLPAPLQKKLQTSEVSVPYDAAMNIARVEDQKQQEHLVGAVLKGATNREIREKIADLKGKPGDPPRPKPKEVYRTAHNATVIVQSLTQTLTRDRKIQALKEALKKATAEK